MAKIGQFKEILEEYSNQPVDFVLVYVEEAHPLDEWNVNDNKYKITQPTTLQERLSTANTFAQDTKVSCPVLVDNMLNEASTAYGAMPERLYVIYNGIVTYEGSGLVVFYNLNSVKKSVDEILKNSKKEN